MVDHRHQQCLTCNTTHTKAPASTTAKLITTIRPFAFLLVQTESSCLVKVSNYVAYIIHDKTISTNALLGGWDPQTSEVKSDLLEEIDQAFSNVELALKDAGIQDGWKSVFRVTSYHAGFDGNQERVFGKMVANFEKYMPGHEPIWTCVGVTALALPQMRIEIEVVAIDGK